MHIIIKHIPIRKFKRVYTEYNFGARDQEVGDSKRVMTISGDVVKEVGSFKYPVGSFVKRNGSFMFHVKHQRLWFFMR